MARLSTLGIIIDATGAKKGARETQDALGNVEGSAKRAMASMAQAAAVLATALGSGALLGKFIEESINAQNATAQLGAVIKSTGGAAGRTVQDLQRLSGELQAVSVFGDDAIQSAQGLLLTFTRIRGENFDRATRSVVDLAQAMGGDLRGAALQLGKALNDPAIGLTMLTRSGISFSQAQQAVIKDLQSTGKLAEAQTLILKELETQFGGSAAAARDTLGGAIAGLKNSYGDLFELPRENTAEFQRALESLTTVFIELKVAMDDSQVIAKFAREMGNLAHGAIDAARAFGEFGKQVDIIGDAIGGVAEIARGLAGNGNPFDLLGDTDVQRKGLREVSAAVDAYGESWGRFFAIIKEGRAREAESRRDATSVTVGAGGFDLFGAAGSGGVSQFAEANAAAFAKQREAAAAANRELTTTEKAFAKLVQTTTLATERQRALTAAHGDGKDALAELTAAYELKGKLAEIDATYTGAQRAELRGLVTALAEAEAGERALTNALAARAKEVEFAALRAKHAKAEAAALREVQDAVKALNTRRAEGAEYAAKDLQTLERQLALHGLTGDALAKLNAEYLKADKAAEYRAAGMDMLAANDAAEQFVAVNREVDALTDGTMAWADALLTVTGIAGGLASAFGEAGRELAQLANNLGTAIQGASQLRDAGNTKNAAGSAVGIGGALSGAGGSAAALSALSGVGAIFSGVVSIIGGFTKGAREQRERLEREREAYTRALADFTDLAVSGLAKTIRDMQDVAADLAQPFEKGRKNKFASDDYLARMDAEIGKISDGLKANLARLADDVLGDINRAFNSATGNDSVNAIIAAQKAYAASTEDLSLLLLKKIITEEQYQLAMGQSLTILQSVTQAIQDAAAAEAARTAAIEAAKVQARAFNARDIGIRGLRVAGDDRGALQAELDLNSDRELDNARQLVAAGELTAEAFAELARVLGQEVTNALAEFDAAAARTLKNTYDNLAVRTLVARGEDEEAKRLRQKIANDKELFGITDPLLRAEIEYVQWLEAEGEIKAVLAAKAEAEAQKEQTRRDQNENIDIRRLRAQGLDEEADAMARAIDREKELRGAVDDATRARYEELYAMEDAAAAMAKVTAEAKAAAAAQEKLAGLTGDLNIDILRESGNDFEADRLSIIAAGNKRRDELIAAGASPEVLADLDRLIDLKLGSLIKDTFDKAEDTNALGEERDSTTRSVTGLVGITNSSAMRLVDYAATQLIVQRQIEANTRAGGSGSEGGIVVHVYTTGGLGGNQPAAIGREIAQSIMPYVRQNLGRAAGTEALFNGAPLR